jgi:hypothetical protein
VYLSPDAFLGSRPLVIGPAPQEIELNPMRGYDRWISPFRWHQAIDINQTDILRRCM